MDENNQQTDSRSRLTEMDKIFIPEDLDSDTQLEEYTDYKRYKLKFWRTVPENCALVTRNIFTGKIKFHKTSGIKWFPPIFVKSILVSTVDRNIPFKNVLYRSSDRIEDTMDLSLNVSIVNPAKYMRSGKAQLNRLRSTINELVRVYSASLDFETLFKSSTNLNEFDPNGELTDFQNKYGIRVNRVKIERVGAPERIKKLANDRVEERLKAEADEIKRKNNERQALSNAKIKQIEAEAEAKRISAIEQAKADAYVRAMQNLVISLKNNGVSDELIPAILEKEIMSKNKNTVFMGSNNGIGSDIAMGIAAGQRVGNQHQKSDNRSDQNQTITNSQKLLNAFDLLEAVGVQLSGEILNLKRKLTEDEKIRKVIDNASTEDFNNLYTAVMQSYMSVVNSESKSNNNTKK